MNPFLRFATFQTLFFLFMWLSKTLQVVVFEAEGKIANFGASYSAMALAGYFSFLIGHYSDHCGIRKTIVFGGILYGIGLGLRMFPESLSVCIFGGLVAGFGASSVLCGIRLWMLQLATPETTARLVGLKSSTMALGTALGCLIAGAGSTYLLSPSINRSLLGVAAVGMFSLTAVFALLTPSTKIDSGITNAKSLRMIVEPFRTNSTLAIMIVILGLMTGFYVSFVSPYLPLIMKDKGFTMMAVGLSTAAFGSIRFLIDPIIARAIENNRDKCLRIFLISEFLIILALSLLLLPLTKAGFIAVLLARSVFMGFSMISEEVLWLRHLPREHIGLFMGLNQSAFFLGDFVGGISNGMMYKNFGLDLCVVIVLIIMTLNAGLFYLFFRGSKSWRNSKQNGSVPCLAN